MRSGHPIPRPPRCLSAHPCWHLGGVGPQCGQLTLSPFPFAPFPLPRRAFATATAAPGPVPATAAGPCPSARGHSSLASARTFLKKPPGEACSLRPQLIASSFQNHSNALPEPIPPYSGLHLYSLRRNSMHTLRGSKLRLKDEWLEGGRRDHLLQCLRDTPALPA